jgi:hypothetical protein
MSSAEWKDFAKPDEVRTFPHGRFELLHIGGGTVGRMTLDPGWRWSTDVKPIASTEWCEAPHFQYMISGRIHIKMKDGTEADLGEVALVDVDEAARLAATIGRITERP